jgi:tetraacyldisaccharide 4'-kinase
VHVNEAAFRDLISGKRRGAIAGMYRTGLSGLACFYETAVRTRNKLFDAELLRTHSANVPVVSVGNMTTGGTGKTPFVAFVAHWFGEKGACVALLSRGYRALPGAVNDEKLVLDLLCPGIPHVQNPDRVAGAQVAVRDHGAQLIVLDDGFQHRRLARDLDVVLVDALCPWGYGAQLPRGLLREPATGLRRADIVVLTRADQCDEATRRKTIEEIERARGKSGVVEVAYPPVRLRNSAGQTAEFSTLAGQPVMAFCGIGNPDGFRKTLGGCNLAVDDASFRTFPDHYHYTPTDLESLATQAARRGAQALLTTQKDLVKINQTHLGAVPLWAVEIGTKIVAGAEELEMQMQKLLK